MKAIVYTSNTGFTKKYANLLSDKIGIPAYDSKYLGNKLKKQDEIIYFSHVIAGKIEKFEKIKRKCNIKVVCAVGMLKENQEIESKLIEKNKIKSEKFYYLQGGLDRKKLSGKYKLIMNIIIKIMKITIEQKETKTDEEKEILEMIEKGKDCVTEESLLPILKWTKENGWKN